MLDVIKTINWIPVLALLGAAWVEERPSRTSGMITLTAASGKALLIHASHVYAVHEGEKRLKSHVLTSLHISGQKPFLVRETVDTVMQLLAGDWVHLHLATSGRSVYVDTNEISTVGASVLKKKNAIAPFAEIQFTNGNRIRVGESPDALRRLLGAF